MCEPLMIRAAKKRNGFDFNPVFSGVQDLLSASDYVIGNLETPIAGSDFGYCCDLFSFNAPDAFASAVKNAGINMVSVANNHVFDRGEKGLERTLETLKTNGVDFSGAVFGGNDGISYFVVDEIRFALVCGTYGTNCPGVPPKEDSNCTATVNILSCESLARWVDCQQEQHSFFVKLRRGMYRLLSSFLSRLGVPRWKTQQLAKLFHIRRTIPYADHFTEEPKRVGFSDQVFSKLKIARENADFVLFLPHIGGQFNTEPGPYSREVIKAAAESGLCDVIVASHSHVVQKAEYIEGVPCFYSIGNFSASPNSYYLPEGSDTEFGLAVHLDFTESGLKSVGFTVLEMTENHFGLLKVVPIDCMDEDDMNWRKRIERVVNRVYGDMTHTPVPVKGEYPFLAPEMASDKQ